MRAKLLHTIIIFCAITFAASAQLPLPIRTIGGMQFYYHEVKKKETVYSIANKLKISAEDIIKYNPDAAKGLTVNQYLFFPVADFKSQDKAKKENKATATEVASSFSHKVEKGETLYGIAKNYGVSINDIVSLNPNANAGIKEGQTLTIPQAKAVAEKQASTTSDKTEQRDTSFVYVTIRPGDTLFSMAKRYNTSIDKIMELNPGISPKNFRSGEIIRVRQNYFTVVEAEKETTVFQTYDVQRGDTYESVAKQFNVDVKLLKSANPELKKLRRGRTIYIPITKTETVLVEPNSNRSMQSKLSHNESPEIQEMYDSVHFFRDDNNVNVALMLPFMLNTNTPAKQTRLFTEFYKGFLLAVDTIQQMHRNKKINIFAYDTRNSSAVVDSLLSIPTMAEMDMIFTPENSEHIERIAKYGTENKIAVINSFSLKNDIYNDYPTLFQVNTPQNYMHAKLFDYFDENFHGYEVLFLNLTTEAEKEMIGELKSHLSAKNVKYSILNYDKSLQADTLSSMLTEGKRYVIIPTSSSRNILLKSLDAIKNVKFERYDIKMCLLGHPEWVTFMSEFKSDFNQIDTYIYSRFYTMDNENGIQQFDEKFFHWYGEYMIYAAPRFGLLGYDTGCYFLRLFMRGKDYNNNFSYKGLQNSFDFDRISNWSGFINKAAYFIHLNVFNTIETNVK